MNYFWSTGSQRPEPGVGPQYPGRGVLYDNVNEGALISARAGKVVNFHVHAFPNAPTPGTEVTLLINGTLAAKVTFNAGEANKSGVLGPLVTVNPGNFLSVCVDVGPNDRHPRAFDVNVVIRVVNKTGNGRGLESRQRKNKQHQ